MTRRTERGSTRRCAHCVVSAVDSGSGECIAGIAPQSTSVLRVGIGGRDGLALQRDELEGALLGASRARRAVPSDGD